MSTNDTAATFTVLELLWSLGQRRCLHHNHTHTERIWWVIHTTESISRDLLVMCGWVVEWKGKAAGNEATSITLTANVQHALPFFSVMLVNLVHAAESESALETRDHRNQSPVWTSEAVLLCPI